MAIPKKLRDRFGRNIKALSKMGFGDKEITKFLEEQLTFEGWEPITLRDLIEVNHDFTKLFSYCWHDGKPRCDTIGITDVNIKILDNGWILSYSDNDGDPTIYINDLDEPIDNIGNGEWNYGLYWKKPKKK